MVKSRKRQGFDCSVGLNDDHCVKKHYALIAGAHTVAVQSSTSRAW